jgi:hypothetical protein
MGFLFGGNPDWLILNTLKYKILLLALVFEVHERMTQGRDWLVIFPTRQNRPKRGSAFYNG